MRRKAVALGFLLTGLAIASVALAQTAPPAPPMMGGGAGMPNLASIVGRPLPDRGMPAGTVSVRVSRKSPANAVADAEVSAIIKNAGGDLRQRTAKTDSGGRALFEGIAPGDEFRATVKVDGEELTSETFPMPADGGIRTMLIAGIRAEPGEGAGSDADAPLVEGSGEGQPGTKDFTLGATAGAAFPAPALPTGVLEVRLFDEAAAPISNHAVVLGMVNKDNHIDVRRGKTDASGMARFDKLPGGQTAGYAAVIQWRGMRLGTAPFGMPETGGARAEIRALARTADPSVIAIGTGGRVVVQMHEDTLQFLEMLPLENTSDKMFDPAPGAIEIPLPSGFVGAEAQENEHKIEVRANHGVAVHGPIPPKRTMVASDPPDRAHEVQFGFVLPTHSDTREFVQPMPNGIGPLTLITEQIPGLSVTGANVGAREERTLGGRKYWIMPVEGVPPGGALTFTLRGLPATSSAGRNVAGVLSLLLVAGAIGFGRRPKPGNKGGRGRGATGNPEDDRARLIDRREALFASLVAVESEGAASVGPATGGPGTGDRRRQLVAQLEQVYRQLAAADEQRVA